MPGSQIEMLTAEANVRFDADENVLIAPFFETGAAEFAKAGPFTTIGAGMNQLGAVWSAQGGTMAFGANHLLLEEAYGNKRILGIKTNGYATREQLLDVLQSLLVNCHRAYAVVKGLSSESVGPVPTVQTLGPVLFGTTAVLRLPKEFADYVGMARPMTEFVETRLKKNWVIVGSQFNFGVTIQFRADSKLIGGKVTFEPRVETDTKERIFFTESPLPPNEHLALIDALAGTSFAA